MDGRFQAVTNISRNFRKIYGNTEFPELLQHIYTSAGSFHDNKKK